MLTKEVVIDSVEVTEFGCLNVRQVTRILEDDVVISKSYNRHVINPGDSLDNENNMVVRIANAVWTEGVINKYKELAKMPKIKETGLVK